MCNYSVSQFSDEGPNSYQRLHTWTNLNKIKSWLILSCFFKSSQWHFWSGQTEREKHPLTAIQHCSFQDWDQFQGICSSLREPLWDTLIHTGLWDASQKSLAPRTCKPDSSGQRGRQVLNPLWSNCHLLPQKINQLWLTKMAKLSCL